MAKLVVHWWTPAISSGMQHMGVVQVTDPLKAAAAAAAPGEEKRIFSHLTFEAWNGALPRDGPAAGHVYVAAVEKGSYLSGRQAQRLRNVSEYLPVLLLYIDSAAPHPDFPVSDHTKPGKRLHVAAMPKTGAGEGHLDLSKFLALLHDWHKKLLAANKLHDALRAARAVAEQLAMTPAALAQKETGEAPVVDGARRKPWMARSAAPAALPPTLEAAETLVRDALVSLKS